jgi:ribose 5-phosphate isomerase A
VTTGSEADRLKRAAALRALDSVRDGMVLGLGSGSTAEIAVAELGGRVRKGLRVVGVPTSRKVAALAERVGVPLSDLDERERLDLTIDGADEIDLHTFNLIKGRGGSLLREKLVAAATDLEIIVADDSKLVTTLGERRPVPVEVVQFGWRHTSRTIKRLGCKAELRQAQDSPFISDEGHYILDCHFGPIADPEALAREIKAIVGVVEHGLFIGLADQLIIASASGVRHHERGAQIG